MELKTDRQQQQQQEEEKEEEMQQKQKEQHFHVLAVDDSVIDRKLLEKLLKVSSCQVTCVESVDKALEYLGLLNNLDCDSSPSSQQDQGLKVNLIITDFCMPGMSGYDLLKRVKGSSWKDVPVVVMSSENVPSRISMCMEGGAEEFMLKPLQLSDLDKIQAYLLRSPDHSSTNIDKDLIEEEEDDNNKIEEDDNSKNSGSNNNNSYSKRKAISSEAAERIPKMKGVGVPVVV